jgi:protoporphyrinogen oxidase
MHDRFIPYPVQTHLGHLPEPVAWACLKGLLETESTPHHPPAHFAAWLAATFGDGLLHVFLQPYNEKVWAHPLHDMSCHWIAERVAVPSLDDIITQLFESKPATDWGPNSTFRFPATGGTGHIWQSLAARIGSQHFAYNETVSSISPDTRQVTCASGQTYTYGNLISTMPVTTLCQHLPAPPDTSALRHSSTHIIGIGLRGQRPPSLAKKTWVYFPEANCPFYRATVFSNYSPNHCPPGHWSLMTETSESAHKPVNPATLAEETVQSCLNTGLIASRDDITSVWQYRAEHGYPIPTLGRDETLARIIPALEAMHIYSRGRFGGWKYEVSNQDHSFMQGVELIDRLVHHTPETTYAP